MSTIIEMLEVRAKNESKIRAVLKRSIAFNPGTYAPAFPYIEPWVAKEDNKWKRTVYYLIAGVWALHWREGIGRNQNFPEVCRRLYLEKKKSPSVEKRFITLLDADEDEVPYRLRQMVALLRDYPVDFDSLLKDLLSWNHPDKFIQVKWARKFYQNEETGNDEVETSKIKGGSR